MLQLHLELHGLLGHASSLKAGFQAMGPINKLFWVLAVEARQPHSTAGAICNTCTLHRQQHLLGAMW